MHSQSVEQSCRITGFDSRGGSRVSGYPGLSPETLIYVSEYTGYKSNKTGYAEKLHWLSGLIFFKATSTYKLHK